MSRATVTVRELKNKETGIDLSVTSFKETKGMIGSSYEYQVVVVSNLSCFKSAKHKETDNVQFTVMKKLTDFEDLHAKFNTKFSGTAFPLLPKKVLMMNEGVAKERRNALDHFVKFLACTPKLCTETVLLEFLGVSSVKAGKLQKMEVSESIVNKSDDTTIEDVVNDDENVEDETNDDLFGDNEAQNDDDDEDLFGAEDVSTDKEVKIFADQDFSGAVEEGEDDDLFIVGAKSEVKVVSKVTDGDQEEEDNEDLFNIDDDLEDIMKMKITTKLDNESEADLERNDNVTEEADHSKTVKDTTTDEIDSVPVTKPLKPALKAKPALPKRKDKATSNSDSKDVKSASVDDKSKDVGVKAGTKPKPPLKKKPDIAGKPDLKPKPSLKPKTVLKNEKVSSVDSGVVESGDITSTVSEQISTEDDILKYIQDNAGNEEDIDLFS